MPGYCTDKTLMNDVAKPFAFFFNERIKGGYPPLARLESLGTLQLNLGDRCNLACVHCHVGASPEGEKIMGKEVIDAAVAFLRDHEGITLDITGGCPELNPHFDYLIAETDGLDIRRLVRTNLVITTEAGMEGLPEFYRDHGLAVIASLPCFSAQNVNKQRGKDVFERSIAALKKLNDLGYGDTLELTLVYNPGDDSLPGLQEELEGVYRKELANSYGICFTRLLALNNVPIGRFREYLESRAALARYLRMLAEHFNCATLPSLMCRSLISVDWIGRLYNCDFNQAVQMVLRDDNNAPLRIDGLEKAIQEGIPIQFSYHCFACTAGEGSGCFGQHGHAAQDKKGSAI